MPDRPRRKRTKPAAGIPAVVNALRHLRNEDALGSGIRALRVMNQKGGFDCPGCAWPEPNDRHIAEFCENGAKAVAAESTGKRADPDFFARHSVPELLEKSGYWLEQQGRLTHPMIRRADSDRYEPISWAEAFEYAGAHLRELDDPDRAAFYTSGRTSNEAAFIYQLLGRMLGTNNLPDCSNLCHESSGVALARTIGHGKGSVQLVDFTRAEAIFIIGQNPGTNHPRMLSTLLAARRRGAEIVSINPLRERGLESFTDPQEPIAALLGRGTDLSTVYLQPLPGSDVAVLTGIMKHVLHAEKGNPGRVLDHGFIRKHTNGFTALTDHLDTIPWSEIERQSGLTESDIRPASDVYIRSRATILCWAMGLTQHVNAVDNIIACSNLLLMRGNLGKPGAGACPVRGHSNVQGDRTMGITAKPRADFLDALEREFGFTAPREPGLDTVESIRAMREGRISFFMSMGGNLISAGPDTTYASEAIARTDLCVHVATKLNRSHLVTGREAMIWPCLGRTEEDIQPSGPQTVSVEDSMSCVHGSRGRNEPASPELLSEPAIVARLARAALPDSDVDWEEMAADYDRIRSRIERVIPGFEDYNARLREPGGFVLPQPTAVRDWLTESGRAEFITVPMPDLDLAPDQLRLFTIRSHDQFNTTIYALDDRYRGVKGERRVVFMHPDDIAERGLAPRELVDIESGSNGTARVAEGFRAMPYDIPRGSVAAYFPEANVLVPIDSTARGSNTPSSKMIPVTIRRAD
jgi:molybdopterin-dependent oxidoreductase alpha subunit